MTPRNRPTRASLRDLHLDADELKAVPIERVLQDAELLSSLTWRGPSAKGPSPFTDGTLSINTQKNVWNDSGGRPKVEGRIVPGNVIGLVQAIEAVSFRRALELLHERYTAKQVQHAEEARAEVAASLRREGVQAQARGNTPFGKRLKGLAADVAEVQGLGLPAELAKARGIGLCRRGLMQGRVVFPILATNGTVMAYTGLDPGGDDPENRWKLPSGFRRRLELYGIHRVHEEADVRERSHALGLTLCEDPLEAELAEARTELGPAVSPMGAELSEVQLRMLLDPAINPTRRLALVGSRFLKPWSRRLITQAFICCPDLKPPR